MKRLRFVKSLVFYHDSSWLKYVKKRSMYSRGYARLWLLSTPLVMAKQGGYEES
jgi:hypothetical protein